MRTFAERTREQDKESEWSGQFIPTPDEGYDVILGVILSSR